MAPLMSNRVNEFHASSTKKPKAAQTCYLRSSYPYPCSLRSACHSVVAHVTLWCRRVFVCSSFCLHRIVLESLLLTADFYFVVL